MAKFTKNDIQLKVEASDCFDAIQKSADLLIASNAITENYVKEIFATYKKFGPYFVIAPGIALAHSRPSKSVRHKAISLITLKSPINFGNKENDPVFIVCVIASTNGNDHIALLKQLGQFLGIRNNIEFLKRAEDQKDVCKIVALLNKKWEE